MNKYIKNQRGSGLFLTIFSFAIVGIMLIFILNIAMVFTKKEQASIAAEQASFAATSVVYEEVNKVVESHVKVVGLDENGFEILEPLKDKVDDRESTIRSTNPKLSPNEVHIQAVNDVLLSEIPSDDVLEGKITQAISGAESSITGVVEKIIKENKGKDTDYKILYFNEKNRIEVIAKTEFEAAHHNGLNFGNEDDIPQVGIGPEISFISKIDWRNEEL